ncbi:hypothetical protein GCM10020256_09460 [Streptomyces thermocoprophilus]
MLGIELDGDCIRSTVDGCTADGEEAASFAAARMSAAVRAGVRHTAAYRETWSFTATLRASGA